jgi:hypothetical protein
VHDSVTKINMNSYLFTAAIASNALSFGLERHHSANSSACCLILSRLSSELPDLPSRKPCKKAKYVAIYNAVTHDVFAFVLLNPTILVVLCMKDLCSGENHDQATQADKAFLPHDVFLQLQRPWNSNPTQR